MTKALLSLSPIPLFPYPLKGEFRFRNKLTLFPKFHIEARSHQTKEFNIDDTMMYSRRRIVQVYWFV